MASPAAVAVVYVVVEHRSRHRSVREDYTAISKLSAFEEVRFCLQAGDRPSEHPQTCVEKLNNILAEYRPERDYLVWMGGDATAMFLLGAILPQDEPIRWLRYEWGRHPDGSRDPSTSTYVPFTI